MPATSMATWHCTSHSALIPRGALAQGPDEIRPALQALLDLGGTITLDTNQVVTVGELAHLTNRWSLSGTAPDGEPLDMGALTAKVARRQPEGTRAYVIDNAGVT